MDIKIWFVLLGIGTLTALVLILIYQNRRRTRKLHLELRALWGKPKDEYFDFEYITRFAKISSNDAFHRLSNQTINDIDFYKLFCFIDRTTSRIGQQYLYKKVSEPTDKIQDLLVLDHRAKLFTEDTALRERIQLNFTRLSNSDAYTIANLLKEDLVAKPKWFRYLWMSTGSVLVLGAFSTKFPILFVALFVPVILNIFLHYWNKNNLFQFVKSFPQLNVLIEVSSKVIHSEAIFSTKEVETSILSFKAFQRKVKLLYLGQDGTMRGELENFGLYFLELAKAILLVELYTTHSLAKELTNRKKDILTLFNFVGNLDASLSVASLRAGSLSTCQPTFTTAMKSLSIRGLRHPLIKNCVANDLNLDNRSILITGSNMSGKTTFLRTVAISSILAQTIYTCFADSYSAPFLKQFSSIRIDDDLLAGKSYYFEEVNVIGSLVSESKADQQNLFVLDEVFRGTNTVERIAAGKAILSYLNHGMNLVIVSTHDIELADMLMQEYELYHFSESVEGKELRFDHTLKDGPLKTRNAITILEIADYPNEIVMEARMLSSKNGTNSVR